MPSAIHLDRKRIALAAAVAVLAALAWLGQDLVIDRTLAAERARLEGVAALAASNFRRQVDTFELVATTLSADPEVERVLKGSDPAAAGRLNERLATLTARLDASVIYLMDRTGTTVVSSNWRQPDSFLGDNYRFRSYFVTALASGRSSQFALGTRSRIPGLFIGRRIDGASGPLGVLVVKIRFDRLEREWARSIGEAFVTDSDGVILVTSDPGIRFRTTTPVSAARKDELRAGQAFGDAPLTLHPAFARGLVVAGEHWRGEPYLAVSALIADRRELTVLSPVGAEARAARTMVFLVAALIAVAVAAGMLGLSTRKRLLTARAREAEQRRAADLRTRFEQANRLSSLGQVAAGVGHEINQPLAAIGMRADSAGRLLGTGRYDEARAALGEIDGLVARVGAITGELRKFARRSDRSLGTVRLADAFAGLTMLMRDTLAGKGARLSIPPVGDEITVVAEQGRLEQVLVNLVQNALDAGGNGTSIAIDIEADDPWACITVRDDGPGIPDDVAATLFQPFTSTKAHGLGLGLVICRDIVTEFGGELSLLSTSGTGAAFVIRLRRAS